VKNGLVKPANSTAPRNERHAKRVSCHCATGQSPGLRSTGIEFWHMEDESFSFARADRTFGKARLHNSIRYVSTAFAGWLVNRLVPG
jgi:hypothetical protein